MHKLLSITAAVLLLSLVTAAQAYPNLNATTGIMAVPTAVVVTPGSLTAAGDVLFMDDTTFNGRVLYGLAERFEVGAGIIAGEDTAFGATGKYRMASTIAGFNWALGASIVTGNDVDEGFQIFATGTRPIALTGMDGTQLLGTLGINFTDIDTASALRPFVGAQLLLGDMTEVDAEFVFETGDFDESVVSLLVRHRFTPQWAGQFGFTNAFGFTGTADHDLFVGAAYTFE